MSNDDMLEYVMEALDQRQCAHHQAIGALSLVMRHLAAAAASVQRTLDALVAANEYTAAHASELRFASQQSQDLV